MKLLSADSRDCGRAPIPWNSDINGGFTTGEPWLKLHDRYADINVEADMKAHRSVFEYYKKLIRLHLDNKTILYGDFHLEYNKGPVSVYSRCGDDGENILVICNFSNKEQSFKLGFREILLTNYEGYEFNDCLPPYAALVVK